MCHNLEVLLQSGGFSSYIGLQLIGWASVVCLSDKGTSGIPGTHLHLNKLGLLFVGVRENAH